MTDPITPDPTEPTPAGAPDAGGTKPPADETFSWTNEANGGNADGGEHAGDSTGSTSGAAATATAVLEQIRVAIDDIAERATPTVREFSARAAEFAATAADRAAPFAARAGEVTSEASSKLAERSRSWAAEVRASIPTDHPAGTAGEPTSEAATTPDVTPTPPVVDKDPGSGEGASPA